MNRPLIGVLLIGSLALTACGGDDDDKAENSTTTGSGPDTTFGTLDTTFGTDGVANVALSADSKDRLSAVALGTDGKLYAAGLTSKDTDQEIALTRVDNDGKPDATFGTAGVASVNVSVNPSTVPAAQLEQARSLLVQSDGKVVVVGTAEHDATAVGDAAKDTDIVAVRFDATGKPDPTFGQDGVARIDLGTGHPVDPETFAGADQGYGSAALPNGGLVIFGNTTAGADREDNDFVLVGLTSTGAIDPAFGTAGVTRVDLDKSRDSARIIKVVGNQIIATGYTRGADEVVKPVLIRSSIDGKLDTTFGTGGVASDKVLAAVTESYSFGVQGDNYVLTGYGKDAETDKVDLVAYRFTATGELDTTFGTNGVTRIDNTGEDDRGRNLAVLPDGRILYVGSGKVDKDNAQAMVVLLSKDGAPETGFGTNGRILTDLGGNGDSWYGLALSMDSKTAYLAGYSNVSTDEVKSDDSFLGRLKIG